MLAGMEADRSPVTLHGGPEVARGFGLGAGDLLFWPGHVALAMSPDRMIHATAFAMAVIVEPIDDAIARIDAGGDGPFLGIRRPPLAQPAALA